MHVQRSAAHLEGGISPFPPHCASRRTTLSCCHRLTFLSPVLFPFPFPHRSLPRSSRRTLACLHMKLALLFTFLLSTYANIGVTWKDCGTSSNKVKVTNVTWTPKNISPGMTVNITAFASLSEELSDTEVTLTLAAIFKHKFDGCKGAVIEAPLNLAKITFPPMDCPVLQGNNRQFKRYVDISKNMPKGSTTSKLTSTDQDGKPAICCEITLTNE